MSGRLEREPTEVGQAYVICSLSLTQTQAQMKGGSMFEDGYKVPYSSLLTESLAFWNHWFYQHVCAESAWEIIYGFKNTDTLHLFGIIHLNSSPPSKLSGEFEEDTLVYVCVVDG